MADALILACGTGLRGESLDPFAGVSIGGLTQLRRLVRSCLKAGIDTVTVVSKAPESAVRKMLPEAGSGRAKIAFLSPGKTTVERGAGGNTLVLQSNIFFHAPLLGDFLKEKPAAGGAVIMKTRKDGGAAQSGAKPVVRPLGAVIVEPEAVADLIEDCDLSRWVGRYREDGVKRFFAPEGVYAVCLENNPRSVSRAWRLLSSNVGKTSTGWIARNINGRISLPVSSWLARGTSLTPNQISVLTNIITGVPCIVSYLTGYPVLGAVFMQIAAVLDRCDGEVARLKLLETKRGEWVDTLSDQITVGGFVLSVPVGCYLHGNQSLAIALGAFNIAVFLFFLAWSFFFMVRYTGSGSLVSYHRIDELVGGENLSPARRLMAFLRPVMRRNFYSLVFIPVAIFGGYPWVLSVATLGLAGIFIHQIEDLFRVRNRLFGGQRP